MKNSGPGSGREREERRHQFNLDEALRIMHRLVSVLHPMIVGLRKPADFPAVIKAIRSRLGRNELARLSGIEGQNWLEYGKRRFPDLARLIVVLRLGNDILLAKDDDELHAISMRPKAKALTGRDVTLRDIGIDVASLPEQTAPAAAPVAEPASGNLRVAALSALKATQQVVRQAFADPQKRWTPAERQELSRLLGEYLALLVQAGIPVAEIKQSLEGQPALRDFFSALLESPAGTAGRRR